VYWQRVDPKRPEDLRRLSDLYDGGIHYTDAKVGGFLTWLAAQPGWPRTLVVLLSDHGEEFGEHGALRHTTLHRETLHVPLLLRFPDARPEHRPRRVASVVRLIDVMPSLLDYAGLPLPDPVEGRSLLPLLRGEAAPPAFVWSTLRRGGATALRVGEWKLIRSGRDEQLFRVTTDPGEQLDLRAAEPVRAAQLAAQLDALLAAAENRRAAFGAGEVAPLDADTARQLEALGYLDELPAPEP
jgi:arylsulfatase A-like enzyme